MLFINLFFRLLRIRFIQARRWMGEIGLFRGIFVCAVMIPFCVVFLWQKMDVQPFNILIPLIVAVFFLLGHRVRKDEVFLSKHISCPRLLYFGEYCFYSMFLVVLMLVYGQYISFLFYLAILLGIAFLPYSSGTVPTYNAFLRLLPLDCFEWRSGIRQNFFALLFCFGLMIAGIFFWGLAIAAFVLFTLLVLSFYQESEPRHILEADFVTSSRFLHLKLLRHIRYFTFALLPFSCVMLIHNDYWLYTLGIYLAALNLFVFGILMKYTYYRPGTYSTVRSLIVTVAAFLSALLPLIGLVFIANLFLYYSALKNLDTYFYAYD